MEIWCGVTRLHSLARTSFMCPMLQTVFFSRCCLLNHAWKIVKNNKKKNTIT